MHNNLIVQSFTYTYVALPPDLPSLLQELHAIPGPLVAPGTRDVTKGLLPLAERVPEADMTVTLWTDSKTLDKQNAHTSRQTTAANTESGRMRTWYVCAHAHVYYFILEFRFHNYNS